MEIESFVSSCAGGAGASCLGSKFDLCSSSWTLFTSGRLALGISSGGRLLTSRDLSSCGFVNDDGFGRFALGSSCGGRLPAFLDLELLGLTQSLRSLGCLSQDFGTLGIDLITGGGGGAPALLSDSGGGTPEV